ncbi:hypothetical protein E4T42_08815 [Aureobasidium subglaciale]|nr:hypothetical protein E4T42_08815 [Aureobasidium subglaciale]
MIKTKQGLEIIESRLNSIWGHARSDSVLNEILAVLTSILKAQPISDNFTPESSEYEHEVQFMPHNDFPLKCGIEKTIRDLVSKLPSFGGFSAATMTTFLKNYALEDMDELLRIFKQEMEEVPFVKRLRDQSQDLGHSILQR